MIYLSNYFELYKKSIFGENVNEQLLEMRNILKEVRANDKKMMIAGNGASSAISSHVAVDFTKQSGVRSLNFADAGLITCFANDYGYENWVAKAIEFYGQEGDVVTLVSSSGKSPNIVNAATYAKQKGLKVITFTGFSENNPVKLQGDVNFWVDSKLYNIIENTHQVWLLAVCDLIAAEDSNSYDIGFSSNSIQHQPNL